MSGDTVTERVTRRDLASALTRDLVAAAARPHTLDGAAVSRAADVLQSRGLPPPLYEGAVNALGAVLYARPDLVDSNVPAALARVVIDAGIPAPIRERAMAALAVCLSGGYSRQTADRCTSLLRSDLDPVARDGLQRGLTAARHLLPETVDLETALAVAEREPQPEVRETLLGALVEPCLYAGPGAVSPPALERLRALYADTPAVRYCLYALARRQSVPPAVREAAAAAIAGRFPLHAPVRERLGSGNKRVLMIQNIADAQGDEIIRTVPLLQALLDFNRELEVVLLTSRGYLYAHPRITLIPFTDRSGTNAALVEPFDAVINFFESTITLLNHDPALENRLQQHLQTSLPFLYISAEKGYNHFVYRWLVLVAEEYAEALALNRQRVPNIYEATERLIAELGLPLRQGEDPPAGEPVLAGLAERAVEANWVQLTHTNVEARPVALLNPFGGGEPLKGFVERQLPELSAQLTGLIAEGFFVILLPNGTSWGSARMAQRVVDMLPEAESRHVSIAPDPAEGQGDAWLGQHIVPHASYCIHLVIGFVRRADLTVAVEGWMIHAAYCLGRPYRLAMMPRSHGFDWHPHGATRNQRAVLQLSPLGRAARRETGLEESAREPPLEGGPRKDALLFTLRALGASRDVEGIDPLLRALESEDHDVRLAAAEALSRHSSAPVDAAMLRLLKDRWYRVRGAAGAYLLRRPGVWTSALGSEGEAVLRGHMMIAAEPRVWTAVLAIGEPVRDVLEAALRDEDQVIRREASWTLQFLEHPTTPSPLTSEPAARRRIFSRRVVAGPPTVLILTPLKDAAAFLPSYRELLLRLTYPPHLLSLGLLESDSIDGTYDAARRMLPQLNRRFRRARLWKRDFGYRLPPGIHRGAETIQMERRSVLGRSRNHLLFHALDDEDWVLWIDIDMIDYPADIVERLLATGKDIVTPNCVLRYGGWSFDRNAWRDRGRLHLEDLRDEGELVPLDAVGGTMLLVRADAHRDGLVFPAFEYGKGSERAREGRGELETEGLGIMAHDMGYQCWGMPHLEVLHSPT